MGVLLGRRQTFVAQQFLDAAEVGATLQQVGGEAVPKRVGCDAAVGLERESDAGDEPLDVAWADDPFDSDPREGVEWRRLVNTKPDTRPPDFDTDRDGLPDAWELAYKLDPKSPDNNGDADNDGYTNLEEFLHEIAADTPPPPNTPHTP